MRGILETHFRCAKCGSELVLSNSKEVDEENFKRKSTNSSGVTGACKVELSVFVQPCTTCLQPVEDIRKAFCILKGVINEELDK